MSAGLSSPTTALLTSFILGPSSLCYACVGSGVVWGDDRGFTSGGPDRESSALTLFVIKMKNAIIKADNTIYGSISALNVIEASCTEP